MRMTHLSLELYSSYQPAAKGNTARIKILQYGIELRQMRKPHTKPKTIIHQILGRHTGPEKKVSLLFRYIAH